LIGKAGVLQGNVLGAFGNGMFPHEGLGTEYRSRIIEPGQTAAILIGALQRIDLVKAILATCQLDNYKQIQINLLYRYGF